MATNPEAQRKAQAELDRVVGNKRLPDITDRVNLPYIEAIYREVMRLCPVLPLGLPHGLSEDDYYKGFFLPKGMPLWNHLYELLDHRLSSRSYCSAKYMASLNPQVVLLSDDHRAYMTGQ